ncbi:T6SS immunity protein Tli4 family protein [Pseudomonas sp. Ma2-10]
MKFQFHLIPAFFIITMGAAHADAPKQECFGRYTFDAPEPIEWATHSTKNNSISEGGGHTFSKNISSENEYLTYNYSGLTVRVSDITTPHEFEIQRNAILHTNEISKTETLEKIDIKKGRLQSIQDMNYSADIIEGLKKDIKNLEDSTKDATVFEYKFNIPDSYVFGSKNTPSKALLWRNNRIYYFSFNTPSKKSTEDIKGLIARFEPRELYHVPKSPGVCIPYGFIHDDGKTAFSIKNSLRFTSTPNVIMTMINASQDTPTKATTGTYNTDHHPGYDAEKWKKSKIMEKFYFGERMTTLEGWRLDPRPESGEQERAWFAIAHVGGLASPLMAVQMFTFKQGTDGLKDLTPPPEAVIPRFLKLTESIKPQ